MALLLKGAMIARGERGEEKSGRGSLTADYADERRLRRRKEIMAGTEGGSAKATGAAIFIHAGAPQSIPDK